MHRQLHNTPQGGCLAQQQQQNNSNKNPTKQILQIILFADNFLKQSFYIYCTYFFLLSALWGLLCRYQGAVNSNIEKNLPGFYCHIRIQLVPVIMIILLLL